MRILYPTKIFNLNKKYPQIPLKSSSMFYINFSVRSVHSTYFTPLPACTVGVLFISYHPYAQMQNRCFENVLTHLYRKADKCNRCSNTSHSNTVGPESPKMYCTILIDPTSTFSTLKITCITSQTVMKLMLCQ